MSCVAESRPPVPVSGDDVVGPEVEDEDEVLLVAVAGILILLVLATGALVLVAEAAETNDTGLGVGLAWPVGVRLAKRSLVKEPHRGKNKSTNQQNIGLPTAPEPRLGQREYSVSPSKERHQLGTVNLYRDRLNL